MTGILAALAIAGSGAADDIKLGETRTYGDWVAGCDNVLSCEAVALMSEENIGNFQSLVLSRSNVGTGVPLAVKLQGFESESDRYRIMIDGRVIDTGAIDQNKQEITVGQKDGLRLARAIARGNKMRVEDGSGKIIADFSLKGSSASLRYMDARLGLSGTRQAIVAKGRRKLRKRAVEAPVINARKLSELGAAPETADIIRLIDSSPCKADRFGVKEDRTYPLGMDGDTDRALVLLACGSGAYNFTSAVYLAKRVGKGNWNFEAASFDLKPINFNDGNDLPMLVNASWDAENQSLNSYAKGRGLGDCGDAASYVWDGKSFRLTAARSMPTCRGSIDWITVWRANVKFDG